MRICFITNSQGLHAQRWIMALAQRGEEVHVLGREPAPLRGAINHPLPIYTQGFGRQVRNLYRVRKALRGLRPDIIHVFGLFEVNSLGTMWLLWGLPRVVISVLGSDIVAPGASETRRERYIKRFLLRHAQCIVATSLYLARETNRYTRPRRPIRVIPWGVDLRKFTVRKNPAPGVVVGFVKRMHFLAGPDIMLKAFAAALETAPMISRLRMAGDGPMLEELKNMAADLGIHKRIDWSGWIEKPDDLVRLYQSIDLLVMPSRREAFGMAAVEAMACGVPVIASRFGGIPEIVEHERTGLLVASENVAEFAAAIVRLARDAGEREAMGAAARRRAEAQFDWDRSLTDMQQVYRSVAKAAA
jgi:glycosyltransferase involved in cell wall biosynthesis